MISAGYTDREILDKLNVQQHNYRKYKDKIYKTSANAQANLTEDMLITVEDRLIRWLSLLEVKAGEPTTRAAEAAACATVAQDIAIKILKLESEGWKQFSQKQFLMSNSQNSGSNQSRSASTSRRYEQNVQNIKYSQVRWKD